MKLNGWQRVWVVLSIVITIATTLYMIKQNGETQLFLWTVHRETLAELKDPACAAFANAPWQESWTYTQYSHPCHRVIDVRKERPNHAPFTEESLSKDRDQEYWESLWTYAGIGLAAGLVYSLILYVVVWVGVKTYKWIAKGFKADG